MQKRNESHISFKLCAIIVVMETSAKHKCSKSKLQEYHFYFVGKKKKCGNAASETMCQTYR